VLTNGLVRARARVMPGSTLYVRAVRRRQRVRRPSVAHGSSDMRTSPATREGC
jgi:hypothetical protein